MSEQCPPNSTCHNTNGNFADFQPDLFHSRVGRNEQAWTPLNVACTQATTILPNLMNAIKWMICLILWLLHHLQFGMSVYDSTVWSERAASLRWSEGCPTKVWSNCLNWAVLINDKAKACFCTAFSCLKFLRKHILVYCSFNLKWPPRCFGTVKMEAVKTQM